MHCVWWDQSAIFYYKLLEPGETVNAQRYHQEMINLNYALIEKTTKMGQETWQSDFITRQCPVSHIKTGERHLEITWMGHPSTLAVILSPGGI